MEGNLIKLEQGKIIEDIGNVAITFHAPDHSGGLLRIYLIINFLLIYFPNVKIFYPWGWCSFCFVATDAIATLLSLW